VLAVKWGTGKDELTLIRPDCPDCRVGHGFTRFVVDQDAIYIFDDTRREILVFKDGKYKSSIRVDGDEVIGVTQNSIAVLDSRGKLALYDKSNGTKIAQNVVMMPNDVSKWVSIFESNAKVVVHKNEPRENSNNGRNNSSKSWRVKCFHQRDLTELECGAAVEKAATLKTMSVIYMLDNDSFASIGADEAWLYAIDGSILAAVPHVGVEIHLDYGYPTHIPLIYPTKEGVYYLRINDIGVNIVLKKWQR
jgi:hypothetical protein